MSELEPPQRVRLILLGASNLTKGISLILDAARRGLDMKQGDCFEVMLAYGHGRSYGMESRIFGRSLPGILECGLWDAMQEQPDMPTFGLITDIGNDVMYGAEPDLIESWVQTCIDRLQVMKAKLVITALPMHRIRSLPRWQYAMVKSLLFPSHAITYQQAMTRIESLDELIRNLAENNDCSLVVPRREWYGIDPIHIRSGRMKQAWGEIISHWNPKHDPPLLKGSLRRFLALRTKMPQQWRLLGRERGSSQPCCRLDDGTTVAMY